MQGPLPWQGSKIHEGEMQPHMGIITKKGNMLFFAIVFQNLETILRIYFSSVIILEQETGTIILNLISSQVNWYSGIEREGLMENSVRVTMDRD